VGDGGNRVLLADQTVSSIALIGASRGHLTRGWQLLKCQPVLSLPLPVLRRAGPPVLRILARRALRVRGWS